MAGSRGQQAPQLEKEVGKPDKSPKVESFSEGEELDGKLAHSESPEDKLARSVLENDKDLIPEGTVLSEGMNHGLKSFTPDLLFEQLVKDYKQAKQLYGERLIRELSGYEPGYVERNVRIPEFKRELEKRISQSIKNLKDEGLLDEEGRVTDDGMTIASISMVAEELERMNKKGVLGERANTSSSLDGEPANTKPYQSHHRYADIALHSTLKKAIRRGHKELLKDDFVVHNRESKERATIIYAIDASGSMKGEKITAAKRAGIALSYKAIRENDLIGTLIFGKEVIASHPPTNDFLSLVKTMMTATAAKETDIAETIRVARELFNQQVSTKNIRHLVLLTDGLQTVGTDPSQTVLDQVMQAAKEDITISVIGLNLDEEGTALSEKIAEIGKGSLKIVKNYENLDVLLVEDYYNSRN